MLRRHIQLWRAQNSREKNKYDATVQHNGFVLLAISMCRLRMTSFALPLSLQSFVCVCFFFGRFCCSGTLTHNALTHWPAEQKKNAKSEQKTQWKQKNSSRWCRDSVWVAIFFIVLLLCAADCNGYRMPMAKNAPTTIQRTQKKHNRELYVKRFGEKNPVPRACGLDTMPAEWSAWKTQCQKQKRNQIVIESSCRMCAQFFSISFELPLAAAARIETIELKRLRCIW